MHAIEDNLNKHFLIYFENVLFKENGSLDLWSLFQVEKYFTGSSASLESQLRSGFSQEVHSKQRDHF